MANNPNVKRVVALGKSVAKNNAGFNTYVDESFDQGLGRYQESQEATLSQIDALYEKTQEKIEKAKQKLLKQADIDAYQAIVAAYRELGLKGDDRYGTEE